MENSIISSEAEAIAQRIASRAGENLNTFSVMPTITVYNPSKDNPTNDFEIGDIVKAVKTDAGWNNEKYEKPFTGIIIKVRMFLKLKYKYSKGLPSVMTNEFDSYDDGHGIIVKKQDQDGKFQPVFTGNYKQVHDKYSLKDDTTVERKLDLHHALYVLRDLNTKDIVRIDSKGLSRSNLFDYMRSFTRRGLDTMSAHWTTFSSETSDTDMNGKPRQAPVAAFTFTKGAQLSVEELKQLDAIQAEFEAQLYEKDMKFGNVVPALAEKAPEQIEQPAPQEDVPTIQLEEDELSLEDVPF